METTEENSPVTVFSSGFGIVADIQNFWFQNGDLFFPIELGKSSENSVCAS